MKQHIFYEAVATLSGIVGALVLVTGLMPFINPGFVDVNETGTYSPRLAFLVPTLLSLPLLGVSWHFNKKAQALRQQLEKSAETPSRKLKWIIGGIVILLVLSVFLC